jgi:hypothetical protein
MMKNGQLHWPSSITTIHPGQIMTLHPHHRHQNIMMLLSTYRIALENGKKPLSAPYALKTLEGMGLKIYWLDARAVRKCSMGDALVNGSSPCEQEIWAQDAHIAVKRSPQNLLRRFWLCWFDASFYVPMFHFSRNRDAEASEQSAVSSSLRVAVNF